MTEPSNRRAFTMLTVLWVLGTAGMVATTALMAGRNAAGAARNRAELVRARWGAVGCARRAQRAIDSLLSVREPERAAAAWRTLNAALDSSGVTPGCDVVLEAAGTRLDVNWATPEMLERLFVAMGRPDARQLALEVVAMRDSSPLPDLRALRRLRTEVSWSDFDSLLSVEPGRIALSGAPATVLQAIPGFTPEIAGAVVTNREAHGPLADLNDVFSLVSHASGGELEERFQEAARVGTADPDAWLLRSILRRGRPTVAAVVEWRVTRQANRAVLVRSTSR